MRRDVGISLESPVEWRCYVCDHVFWRQRPVCHLVLFDDGDFQADCGGDDHDQSDFASNFRPVGLNHLLERDETLNEIMVGANVGFSFGRDHVGGPWTRYPINTFDD